MSTSEVMVDGVLNRAIDEMDRLAVSLTKMKAEASRGVSGGLPPAGARFAETEADYRAAIEAIGLPCVVKPVMSSSGKGQSTVHSESDIDKAWAYSQSGGRGKRARAARGGARPRSASCNRRRAPSCARDAPRQRACSLSIPRRGMSRINA